MTMELYWGSGSPFAWRVMLALEIKKLPYESKLLEFSKDQHKAPEYLKINPRGMVPTLKDGDFAIGESLAMIAYLDRKQPEPPLFGRTAAETGYIWRAISESVSYVEPAVTRIARPIFSGKTQDSGDDMRDAAKKLHDELQTMEQRLKKTKWLATNDVSAADITVYPALAIALRAAGKDAAKPFELGLLPLAKSYPTVAQWMERVQALPGFDKTYPPHWRTADAATARPSAAAS
jgi:glutathione S-transferase